MPASRLFHHLRNYASAGMLSALVGLVSFPVMTRHLSVADYGIVGLITASTTLFIAFGKLGVQHAVIRFYAQIKNANIAFSSEQMNSTVTAIFLCLAVLTTTIFLLMGFQVLPKFLQYEDISSLFLLSSGIVFVRVLSSGFMNFLRAQQRSGQVAIAQSLSRCLNLCLLLSVVFLTVLEPSYVLICIFIGELSAALYVAYQYRADFYFKHLDISGKLAGAMFVYGIPLMILESLGLILRLSDRYLIEAMLGVDELGQYSASYNLTGYLDIIILAAILQAVRPAYMQMWESQGVVPTTNFLARGFRIYMVIGIPFVAMFAITSPYLLSFLAGPKYAIGTVIIPYVAMSLWLEGAMLFLAAGLYIFKDTKVLMFCSLLATVVNLGLNVLLIPRFGIIGAAAVTLFSFALFLTAVTVLSFRHVKFRIDWRVPLLVALASWLTYFVLKNIEFGSDIYNFVFKGLSGTSVLLLVIWVLEPEMRTLFGNLARKFRNKFRKTRSAS